MSFTDYLRLSEHKIFKEACESLPKDISKALNLLTVRDNVLYTWDFQSNYVLTLNVKAARSREGDNVIHQKLLPLRPPLFTPEFLVANDSGTLLAVAGPNGVLVLELPSRCPPYGAFDNNKELVYCRSHSLDERLLACSEFIEVRQVKFHPGSFTDSHILVLTSENKLRLYQIENNEALSIGVYQVGEQPGGLFPGSKTPFLDLYGEIAVDFDFGHPELADPDSYDYDISRDKDITNRSLSTVTDKRISVFTQTPDSNKITPKRRNEEKQDSSKKKWSNLVWPVYILRGDSSIYSLSIALNKKYKPVLRGPLPMSSFPITADQNEASSIICLNTTPQIVCVSFLSGIIYHFILLDIEEDMFDWLKENSKTDKEVPKKELLAFESIELELGLTTTEDEDKKSKYQIMLHKDESKVGRYFATHTTGVHSVTISCVDDLQQYVNGPDDAEATTDIFVRQSTAEYLVCTKTSSSEKLNPVIGFSLYYEPPSIITLLSDGNLVTLGILCAAALPELEDLTIKEVEEYNSPVKKMLKEPFDSYIEKILQKASTQPILKLSSTSSHTQEQCYDLLQRASQVFREEYFKHHTKAREEIEKRIKTLQMLKNDQINETKRMNNDKQILQEKAESLAEKYEDIKDKQDEILKRCDKLLMLVSRKKSEPSDAEKEFLRELKESKEKLEKYEKVISKVKNKMKYQQVQMENWKAEENRKMGTISEMQSNTIKANLQETNKKIMEMVKEVNKYKKQLNLK